ncbi:MAG: response regulator [Clostridium sp.]|nr:response regulator [Clostridium sp.]MCM1399899.1 response regulator [Clostridium sp.]MCM1460702.1 response regulator [Bacteroides sp.]
MNRDAGKAKILIIDDVETNREILGEIIKDMNCDPVLAESGEQALEILKEMLPELILTDISMPGMDGYELCRILKKNRDTKDIPVVFISAFDDPKDIIEGFSLGGEDYITKPFIAAVVQARVGVHLRLHEVKRELKEMNRKLQISVSEQLAQMENEKKNILYAMANIAAQNSDYEKEHVERIGHNCRILAQGMQLSPLFETQISDTYIDAIELAAPLCDIGNIGISKEILQKKTKLTDEEVAIVRSHTNIGAKLLEDLHVNSDYNDFISVAIDIARCHHENWDGSGYPNAISKEEIPLAAQIVAVVERYCILTGEGNYSKEKAVEMMKAEAGIKFNPDIFEIFCKILRQLY